VKHWLGRSLPGALHRAVGGAAACVIYSRLDEITEEEQEDHADGYV